MGTSDPYLSALKEMGLSVIRLPRPGLGPLTLLHRKGSALTVLGQLSELVLGEGLPKVKANQPTGSIASERTRDLDATLGINLLSGWLSALGGSSAGLNTELSAAKTVKFSFPDVLIDSIGAIALDKYLGTGLVNRAAQTFGAALEDGKLYVITTAAKTKAFTIEVTASRKGAAELRVPEIQSLVGGDVRVSAVGKSKSTIKYEGNTYVYFGFQAVRLFYRDKRYYAFDPLKVGTAAVLSAGPAKQQAREFHSSKSPFTRLGDAPSAATRGGPPRASAQGRDWDDLTELRPDSDD